MGEYSKRLVDSLRDITSEPNRDVVLKKIAVRSSELTDSTDTYVLIRDDAELMCVAQGEMGPYYVGTRFPAGKHIAGEIFETGEPKLVNQYDEWPRRYIANLEGRARNAMGAPLTLGKEVFGVIVAVRCQEALYSELDFDMLQSFAMLASIELNNAMSLEKLSKANEELAALNYDKTQRLSATEEELKIKNRKLMDKNDELKEILLHLDDISDSNKMLLAEYMHDDTLQMLYGTTLLSKAAIAAHRNGGENLGGILEKIYDQMLIMEESLRQTISTMRPFVLNSDNVFLNIKKYLESTQKKSGIHTSFSSNYCKRIKNKDCSTAIFQVVSEAIINAYRHSRCENLDVHVDQIEITDDKYQGKHLLIIVKDDGIGFEGLSKKGHYGIRIMKMRAESIGGRVTIESKIGAGTSVSLYIPLELLTKNSE